MTVRIFYAGMLYKEFKENPINEFSLFRLCCGSEIYNGAYVFSDNESRPWQRMDLTPCLLSDVPKELQLLNLIL